MININMPQRFYQIEHGDGPVKIQTTIDLKEIVEISLENIGPTVGRCNIHIIRKGGIHGPAFYLDSNVSPNEEYVKMVTAWTTYKLATE